MASKNHHEPTGNLDSVPSLSLPTLWDLDLQSNFHLKQLGTAEYHEDGGQRVVRICTSMAFTLSAYMVRLTF